MSVCDARRRLLVAALLVAAAGWVVPVAAQVDEPIPDETMVDEGLGEPPTPSEVPLDDDRSGELPPVPPTPADPFADDGGAVLVRDEAGLFDAPLHSQLRLLLLRLRRSSGIECFLVTRVIGSLDQVEVTAYDLFKALVNEVGHYKVILVLIAIDRVKGQGTVSTNLGAGVYHLVEQKDCEGLFVREGQAFSPDGIKQGLTFRCERLESAHVARQRADLVTGNATEPPGGGFVARWGLVLLTLGSVVLVGGAYLYLAGRTTCPRCGAELKTRVNIVYGTGGSDLARKTYKCFKCGYTKRRALFPTTLGGKKK